MNSSKLHLSLNVADVDRSTAFYTALFGVPPHKTREGYANFDVASPPLKLALNASTTTGPGALNHLGILVSGAEEVAAAHARLTNIGLATELESETTCCHAVQDKVWVRDPDGNAWEVYTILDDNPVPAPAAEGACCASTCCGGSS